MLGIKENKTRISFWKNDNIRFCKLEYKKFIITNGYNKHRNYLWTTFKFDTIENGILIFKEQLLKKNIYITPNDENHIKICYTNLDKNN